MALIAPDDIGAEFAPRRAATVATAELEGEAVLLNEADGMVHHLNPSATLLWSCFDGEASLAEIIGDLAEAFEVDATLMTEQVLTMTRDLGRRALLAGVGVNVDESN